MRDPVRVLHVDDDEEFAALTRANLESDAEPFSVTATADPASALDLLDEERFDCLVTDYDMGSTDGIDLLSTVREARPTLPCILFTARSDDALIERALEAGAAEFLRKGRPAQFALLAHRIRAAVDAARDDRTSDSESVGVDDAPETDWTADDRYVAPVLSQEERIEELASVVSHDLQNPLAIARGYLDRVESGADEEYFEHVRDAHDEIAEVGRDVVTLAREGQPVDRTGPVDVASVVRTRWQEIAGESATLAVESVGNVEANHNRLITLVDALLANAVEFGAPDDAAPAVAVGPLEASAGFYVADGGPGIPADERENALEAGYSTEQQRPGMGLPIARAIAHAHGWTFALAESADGGLRVEIGGVERADGN